MAYSTNGINNIVAVGNVHGHKSTKPTNIAVCVDFDISMLKNPVTDDIYDEGCFQNVSFPSVIVTTLWLSFSNDIASFSSNDLLACSIND